MPTLKCLIARGSEYAGGLGISEESNEWGVGISGDRKYAVKFKMLLL